MSYANSRDREREAYRASLETPPSYASVRRNYQKKDSSVGFILCIVLLFFILLFILIFQQETYLPPAWNVPPGPTVPLSLDPTNATLFNDTLLNPVSMTEAGHVQRMTFDPMHYLYGPSGMPHSFDEVLDQLPKLPESAIPEKEMVEQHRDVSVQTSCNATDRLVDALKSVFEENSANITTESFSQGIFVLFVGPVQKQE